ncbi:toprim domain-containing protein [Porphyromonas sp. COT-108 OH2963]|uniref:toprim domain-containing protein n=1 Tax=Porphyromonas sp. COT-108 OH2963 TaxID=1515614 RepID=UPI001F46B518|nr:toprim domain-containing protein [Porphyromonas sp. COT-108 OH2963]
MDYLSFCTLYPERNTESAVVLNSVNNLQEAHPLLSKYAVVNAYLDNDAAGKKTLEVLRRMNLPVNDCPILYEGHKDLYDFLCRKNQELISPPRKRSRGLKR